MKSLFMPIIGLPNVGKSTLLNALFDEKVSIVTRKPHTTRSFIFASKKADVDAEILFVDTPGIEKVKGKLGQVIYESMQDYVKDLDEILLVLDASNPCIEKFEKLISKSIVVLNKIDYVRKPKLLPIVQRLQELEAKEVFFISALTGDGISQLKKFLTERINQFGENTQHGSLVQEDIIQFAAECVREKLLLELKQEIPYKLFIYPVKCKIEKDSAWEINLNIVVPKKSYKPIVIGKKASLIKSIGIAARTEISAKLNQSGFLGLNVVVDEKLWQRPETYEKLGWSV